MLNVAADPGLSEWVKASISSVVGLMAGIAASPLTLWAKNKLDRKSAREALYSDLGRMYHVLNRVVDIYPCADAPDTETAQTDQRRAIDLLASDINDGVYQYYSAGGAAVFWSLPEALAIRKLYQMIMVTASNLSADHWPGTLASIDALFRQFNLFFNEGRIDEAKVMKYRAEHRLITADAVTRRNTTGKSPLIRGSQGSPKSRWTSAE